MAVRHVDEHRRAVRGAHLVYAACPCTLIVCTAPHCRVLLCNRGESRKNGPNWPAKTVAGITRRSAVSGLMLMRDEPCHLQMHSAPSVRISAHVGAAYCAGTDAFMSLGDPNLLKFAVSPVERPTDDAKTLALVSLAPLTERCASTHPKRVE